VDLAIKDDSLPHWTFDADEVSAGVYLVTGTDASGRCIEKKGTDPDALLVECRQAAALMGAATVSSESMSDSIQSLSDVLAAAGPRPTPNSSGKGAYATRFANASAILVANALRPHFPGIKPDPSGKGVESPSRAVRGLKKLDVNYSTPQAGLGLGISLKSVHSRDKNPTHRFHHNMKRNDEELRVEASGYHQRQPYAVLVAVLFLPVEACEDGDESKPSSFGKWVEYLWPLGGRDDPHDAFDRFERVYVALYDPEDAALEFFDVKTPPPRTGRPAKTLSFDTFVDDVVEAYARRNQLDFRWSGVTDDA